MASIQSLKDGQIKITWDRDDWKGLMPDANYTSQTDTREGSKLSGSIGVMPFRFSGYLSPGYLATDVTTMSAITDGAIIKNIAIPTSGSFAYAIENSTKVHQISAATGDVTNTGAYPHTITPHAHSGAVGSDIIFYKANVSGTLTDCIFYSWNDATDDGDIGRLIPGSSTFDDDFMSTVPAGAAVLSSLYPHPQIVGTDDILYTGNGREIIAYDGQTGNDGTMATLAFKVRAGLVITDFAIMENFLVVYCSTRTTYTQEKGEAYAYFWDYSSEDPTKVINLNCNYVNGGFTFQGRPGVFGVRPTLIPGTFSKRSFLMLFNGGEFETVASFEDKIPGHGGVDVVDEMIIWNAGETGGTSRIYSYGRIMRGFDNELNNIMSCGGGGDEGVCKSTSYNIVLASSGDGGELQSFSTNYGEAFAYTGLVNLDLGENFYGKVKQVEIKYKNQVASGRQFSLKLNTDTSGSTTNTRGTLTTIIDSEAAQTKLVKRYNRTSAGAILPQFTNSIGLYMDWQSGNTDEAHVIHSVSVYIERASTII